MLSTEQTSSNIIFKYTRQEAIDDGVLTDVPLNKLAQEYGIKWHCAMTAGLLGQFLKLEKNYPASLEGICWDMLTIFKMQVIRANILAGNDNLQNGQATKFRVLLPNRRYQTVKVIFSIEEMNGQTEPCWTFMCPEED